MTESKKWGFYKRDIDDPNHSLHYTPSLSSTDHKYHNTGYDVKMLHNYVDRIVGISINDLSRKSEYISLFKKVCLYLNTQIEKNINKPYPKEYMTMTDYILDNLKIEDAVNLPIGDIYYQ